VLADLLREPGVEEILELRSEVGFMALHGGTQDRVTDEIAVQAAARAGASLYAVVQPPNLRWHIPSYRHDPAESDALRRFLDHARVVISVHGYGCDGWWMDWRPPGYEGSRLGRFHARQAFLLGGRDRDRALALGERLRKALPDYPALDDLAQFPKGAWGVDERNPVNLAAEGGVQVECPARVRGLGSPSCRADIPVLVEVLASVACEWA
jgi:phage replication-related protein YjqB (UPF0714/DUF867 family)